MQRDDRTANHVVPPALRPGDTVRVIAPARSLAMPWIAPSIIELAIERLTGLGLRVSFGDHVRERDIDESSSVAHRVADLHAAFRDPEVRLILTVIGGYNSNQLLDHIDWDLVRANPKRLCGFSDITALQNALLARAQLVSWYGPHFIDFGMARGAEYMIDQFSAAMFGTGPRVVPPPDVWSDDIWARDQEARTFSPDTAWRVVRPGVAEGTLVGGNLCTLNLLQGTSYMPSLRDTLLLIEDDEEARAPHFDRNLLSLLQQPDFAGVRGVLVGRFQRASAIDPARVARILDKPQLAGLPIVTDVSFGHTSPRATLPIGGRARLEANEDGTVVLRLAEG